MNLTRIPGIKHYLPPGDGMLTGLDGRVKIPLDGIPIPLLEDDYHALEGLFPSYDAVGRGIYHALRIDPDCTNCRVYALILNDGYPHFVSELASQIIMLDNKDLDIPYLDRKINYLKIFILLEPENSGLLLAAGMAFLDKGLRLETIHQVTANIYQAEKFLLRGFSLSPADITIRHQLGEVSYILGKYEAVFSCWHGIIPALDSDKGSELERRLARISEGLIPRVPPVDYLEAIGGALALHGQGEFEEASAILHDVLDDTLFCDEFPLPEIPYILGLCCKSLGMIKSAENCFIWAMKINPDFLAAATALETLRGKG
jgi:tetratricopeptide (TPR) repeat protein